VVGEVAALGVAGGRCNPYESPWRRRFLSIRSLVGRGVVVYGATVRDRGAGSEQGGQAGVPTMGCEPVVVSGRPCDWPGCAARADP
jgi:hypothetical protein